MIEKADAMYCKIFKGNKEQELYVFVPFDKGEDNIPEALKQKMGVISEVISLEISAEKKLARAKAAKVMEDIREKGFYVQLPPEITGQVLFDGD
jgi:uncharacterized protein YcgL (UPF0745 family)